LYRYGSTAVARYGPNDKDGESLPHVLQALLDVKPYEEVIAEVRETQHNNKATGNGRRNRKARNNKK